MLESWENIKAALKTRLSETNFNTWFKHSNVKFVDKTSIIIELPNRFTKDWVQDNYSDIISDEVEKILGHRVKIDFAVDELMDLPQEALTETAPPQKTQKSGPLNPKYNFENFVTGGSNQFAHAASLAVSQNLAGSYNPLFLYGGVGLGKTHLLCAIGLACLKNNSGVKIIYISGEQFTNDLIRSVRFDKMADFRQRYRNNCDLLLIDDIQFIAGKERTQEEFFHTFNALYESHKQIVLTSDKFPKDMHQLEERLRSRFQWGLIADIQPPDTETRVAILKKKAHLEKIIISDEVAFFLASRIKSNVRELEGALIRLGAFSSLTGAVISVDLAKEALKNVFNEADAQITIGVVQKAVADYFKISLSDLNGHRRMRHFAVPRQIAMYLCRKHTKSSFPEIGTQFGGKDHSTVVHAVQKIEGCIVVDNLLRKDVLAIENDFKS